MRQKRFVGANCQLSLWPANLALASAMQAVAPREMRSYAKILSGRASPRLALAPPPARPTHLRPSLAMLSYSISLPCRSNHTPSPLWACCGHVQRIPAHGRGVSHVISCPMRVKCLHAPLPWRVHQAWPRFCLLQSGFFTSPSWTIRLLSSPSTAGPRRQARIQN